MFSTKSFAKGLVEKKEFFIDICQNCWESKSKLLKNYLLSQPFYYYYKYKTKGVLCILLPQLYKFWEFKFEIT